MTNIEKVQLRIGDTSATIFTTTQIQDFLDENGDDISLSCADALRAIAASARLLDKLEKIGGHTLDRKGLIKSLLAAAAAFQTSSEDVPAYGFFEQAHTDLSAREIIRKEAMRDS